MHSKALQEHMDRWAIRRTMRTPMSTLKDYAACVNAAFLIQRKWRVCIADPTFKMCRNRLHRELQDFNIDIRRDATYDVLSNERNLRKPSVQRELGFGDLKTDKTLNIYKYNV